MNAAANAASTQGVRSWNPRRAGRVARASFAAIGAWILATALAEALGLGVVHAALDLPFSLLCHRIPERVPSLFGVALPLCSRCLGLWGGLSLAAAFAWPVIPLRGLRIVIPVALALMALEVFTQDLGLHPIWHATRLLSGLLVSVPIGGAIGGTTVRELG